MNNLQASPSFLHICPRQVHLAEASILLTAGKLRDAYIGFQANLFHLTKDDISLPIDPRFIKAGVLQYIRKDFECIGHVLAQHLSIIRRLLPGGVSIKMTSHVLDLLLELPHRPIRRSLENHML
ncbi:hypothetical protein M5K25_025719 [Dendrobium thyrsiflorum]|uniref:Uncharacterized protein n=1 Tax=Dendrobium thyrsiflorum TaxID=117978 RepID=A0ABD0U4Q7_DENTH